MRELRGNQPSDANSVLLRRDAAARARRLTNATDALMSAVNPPQPKQGEQHECFSLVAFISNGK